MSVERRAHPGQFWSELSAGARADESRGIEPVAVGEQIHDLEHEQDLPAVLRSERPGREWCGGAIDAGVRHRRRVAHSEQRS